MERLEFNKLFDDASDEVKRQVFYILTTYQSLPESPEVQPDKVRIGDLSQG